MSRTVDRNAPIHGRCLGFSSLRRFSGQSIGGRPRDLRLGADL